MSVKNLTALGEQAQNKEIKFVSFLKNWCKIKNMTDKEMKIERYREENKIAKKGQVVFAGSSLNDLSWSSITISQVMKHYDEILITIEEKVPGVKI